MEKLYNFNDKTKLLTPFWLNIFQRSFQRNSFHTWMDYWAGLSIALFGSLKSTNA